ncbi:MAG: xanthine dehydrogenase family protein subunit M [Anaerolineales bacterium]|jgi:carbon-monoxide dehydrogenase medium subunit
MRPFSHHTPSDLETALQLLSDMGSQALVLAGGTDLLLKMREGTLQPESVVSLRQITELRGIHEDKHGLRIGAATTLREIIRSPLLRHQHPCLVHAASLIGSVQVRSLATIGGNLCNAAPSADMAPPLMALDGEARLVSTKGERQLPLQDFFRGPGEHALQAGELLREIILPPPEGETIYLKHSQRAFMDIAMVGVALRLHTSGKTVAAARVALGAVAPTPLRATTAEQELEGQAPSEDRFARAAALAAEACTPIDDVRAPAWYRRRIVEVLTRRGLTALWRNSQQEAEG